MDRTSRLQAHTFAKARPDPVPTRSVKFNLRTDITMSSKSSPRKSRAKDTSPSKNSTKDTSPGRHSTKDTSPGRHSTKDTSPSRNPPRRSSSKDATSPKRVASSKGASPKRNVSKDGSVPGKEDSSKSSRKLSPATARKVSPNESSSPDRAKVGASRKSLSPVKTGLGSSKRRTPSTGSQNKEQSATSSRDEKKPRPPPIQPPELTASGLKIFDWSGQGMTSIPFNLLNPKDTVGELNVSSNNLRTVSQEIRHMKKLEKLDLSKNGIRCSSSTDFGGLPLELSQLTTLTVLNISECNLPFIPPAIFKTNSLRVLNLSRNKINILPPEIGQLTNLIQLNLQQTNITSLPAEISQCQELEEVYLWGNSIQTLPDTLSQMIKLRVLALNYRSFCSVVDMPYMIGLLKKGQIRSEHIPAVVFAMPALQVLDLEGTKLNSIPDIMNIKLEELYLCKNFLQIIPASIYNLQMLRILDLSNNLLTDLDENISKLRSLKVLRMAHNRLDLIPRTIGQLDQLEELNLAGNSIMIIPPEIRGLQALKVLILEQNEIMILPEEICELTQLHTLDLTSNKIRTLPLSLHRLKGLTLAHSYHNLVKAGLWLYKNPLEQPPPEVWRSDTTESIFKYLKKLTIISTENLQRQKIQLLGESQSGKTSLARILSQGKPKLTNGVRDKTRLLQQTFWRTENNVEFVISDFGGDATYRTLYPLFFDKKSLVLLVYNAATFNNSDFHTIIGQWLDTLRVISPGVVVKIVGTHADLLNPQDDDDLKSVVSEQELKALYAPSEDFEDDDDDALSAVTKSDLEALRKTSTPTPPDRLHYKNIMELIMQHLSKRDQELQEELRALQFDLSSLEKPAQVELTDMEEAILKLLRIREQKIKSVFQNPLRILPGVATISSSDSMDGIHLLIEELEHTAINLQLFPNAQRTIPADWRRLGAMLKQRKGYYLYWDDVQEAANMLGMNENELKECIQFLCDTAEVIWYEDDPGLSQIVFHKPKLLVNIMSSLYRHDMRDFLWYDNKVFMSKGRLNREQFQESADNFLKTGELTRPLLNSFWFQLNMSNDDMEELLELLPMFEICYTVPEPDVPTAPLYRRPLLVIPWYNKDEDLTPLKEVWPQSSHSKELVVIFTFPFSCPPEMFLNISAQIQDFLDERMDWKDHIFGTSETEQLFLQQMHRDNKATVITLVVRGPEFHTVQELMEDLVDAVNSEILKYPGLYWKVKIPMGSGSLQLATLYTNDGKKLSSSGRRTSKIFKPLSFKN